MNRPDLLQNIHEAVDVPLGCKECGIVTGKYDYFHYKVDGFDDKVPISCCTSDARLRIFQKFSGKSYYFYPLKCYGFSRILAVFSP